MDQQTSSAQKFFTPKFVDVVLGLLVLGGVACAGIWWWGDSHYSFEEMNPVIVPTPHETSDWQTYRNDQYGFELKYPGNLTIKDGMKGIIISHSVPYRQLDPCDFRDGTHVLNDVVDFNATLQIFNEDIGATVKANYTFPDDIMKDGKFKLSPGFIDTYSAGDLNGYRVNIGVEGCGINTYYFPLNSLNTLVVSQPFSPERTQLIGGPEKVLSLPGIINPEDEEKIFNQILSTFKFIEIEPTICIQVVTPARNTQTGEVRDFPTPCDVPEGWEKI